MLVLAILAAAGCSREASAPRDPELVIELRWVQAYPEETRRKVETGLDWALSYLGAALPEQGADVYRWHGDRLTLDLDAAAVLPGTRGAWVSVLRTLKHSEEYRQKGAIDIGRFITLTLCSSPQYFALTHAAATYPAFQARHPQQTKPAAVIESSIAKGNRLLEIGPDAPMDQLFFVAYEGTGSLTNGTFLKSEVETLDFMPNGQLRFALYDLTGHLKNAATPALTEAGKPSNCLWCHEIRLQTPFRNVTSVPGYYTAQELRELITNRMAVVDGQRRTLRSRVDFRRINDHTYAELLYLSFNEPSAARLALEWGMTEEQVKARLAGFKTHAAQERPIIGNQLYDRVDIDSLAPYATIRTPTRIREASSYEPDLLSAVNEGH